MIVTRRVPAAFAGVVAAATIAVLSACGSSPTTTAPSGPSQGIPTTRAATTAPATGPLRVADVTARIGCTDVTMLDPQLFTREYASCTLAGSTLYVATFATAAAQEQWLNVAKDMGGSHVVGDGFVITVDSVDVAGQLAQTLGARVA